MRNSLRIAFSAVCGICCVLLIVLWTRSYWRAYILETTDEEWHIQLDYGILCVFRDPPLVPEVGKRYWVLRSNPPLFDEFENFPWPKPSPLRFDLRYKSIQELFFLAPVWSLWVLAAVLAAVPWMRRRFSLRTLLSTTTLAALGLGAIIALSQ